MNNCAESHQEILPIDAELFLDSLLESTGQLIVLFDRNKEVFFFNKRVHDIFGNQDEAQEKIFKYVFPINSEKETQFELNEKIITIRWKINNFIQPLKQKFSILYGDVIDELEELKCQNYTLNYVLKKVPGYIFWKDKSLKIIGCNENFITQTGLSRFEDVIGRSDYDLPWEQYQTEAFLLDDSEIIRTGKPKFNIEEKQRQINGQDLILLTNKVPTYDMQGNISGVLGMYVDITELKETEHELRKAKEEAELINKLKTEFILNLQHDIRTPLGGILGLSSLFSENENDNEKKEALLDIANCARQLLDFCNDIFDFSNIEAGLFPIVKKSFALQTLLEEIMILESPAAQSKDLDFSLYYDENIPSMVMGDPYRVKRILINLVSNAIKFTHEGYVKVSVNFEESKKNGEIIVKMVIEDSGIGIEKEKKNFIYEKLTRISFSNQGIYQGSGLGLTIVKQFVEETSGNIHLQTELGKGTKFTLFLPFILPLSNTILD